MKSHKIVIANWKMNPSTEKEAVSLTRKIEKSAAQNKNVEVIIAPPAPFLLSLKKTIKKAELGAQNVFWDNPPAGGGPYTGETSLDMLKNFGVKYIIVGHSERRQLLGETDEMINKKVVAALKAGFKVVLCVGEPWEIREKGLHAAKNYVKNQLLKDLKGIENWKFKIENSLVIAYEPIWAIGTGKADKPEDTARMAKFIKSYESRIMGHELRVLYGGSVSSENISRLVKYSEIDGVLVGGASLRPKEFNAIVRAVARSR